MLFGAGSVLGSVDAVIVTFIGDPVFDLPGIFEHLEGLEETNVGVTFVLTEVLVEGLFGLVDAGGQVFRRGSRMPSIVVLHLLADDEVTVDFLGCSLNQIGAESLVASGAVYFPQTDEIGIPFHDAEHDVVGDIDMDDSHTIVRTSEKYIVNFGHDIRGKHKDFL